MQARVFPLFVLLTGLFFLTVGNAIVVGDDCPKTVHTSDLCHTFPWTVPPEQSQINNVCPTAGNKCVYDSYYFTYYGYFGCRSDAQPEYFRRQCVAEFISIGPPPVLVLEKCADKYKCEYDDMSNSCWKVSSTKEEVRKPVFTTVYCVEEPNPD